MGLLDLARRLVGSGPAVRPGPASLALPDQLTVYGTEWCGDCIRAKRHLDAAGVTYRWVDLTEDRAAKEMLTAAGLRAIPVIAAPDGQVLVEPSNAELQGLLESIA